MESAEAARSGQLGPAGQAAPDLRVDLLVVGAGPAGLSGAIAAAQEGGRVLVVDEQPVPGGRLPLQVHEEKGGWWKGKEIAQGLRARAEAAGVTFRLGTSVWGLYPVQDAGMQVGWHVGIQTGAAPAQLIAARSVLLATGATQNPVALPGWTLPGVVTAGAVQALVNQHGIKPGSQAVVVGSDPLTLLAARTLTWAGVQVVGIVLPPPGPLSGRLAEPASALSELARHSAAASGVAARVGGYLTRGATGARLAARFYPRGGLRVWGVPLQLRRAALAIEGSESVAAVVLAELSADGRVVPGSEEQVPVDLVVTGAGLSPLVELAAQVGCRLLYVESLGGWVPLAGPNQETEAVCLFVAGSMTGVEGARVAMAQGQLAGLAAALHLGLLDSRASTRLDQARAAVTRARNHASIAFFAQPAAGRATVAAEWAARQPSPGGYRTFSQRLQV